MTDTQELETPVSLVCVECGAERPGQEHDPLCPRNEGDVEAIDETVPEPAAPSQEQPTTVINNSITAEDPNRGGWVLHLVPEHVCIKPPIDNSTFVGSVWRCGDCAQNWLVYERRGKRAGEKAFKRIPVEQAEERIVKHREKLAKAAASS